MTLLSLRQITPDHWPHGVAAVVGRGEPAGSAFLTHGLLLTCAHVVEAAGWSPARPDGMVQVRFRLTGRQTYGFVTTRVAPEYFDRDADVAVLLPREPLPPGAVGLPLAPAVGSAGRSVETFGFPAGYRDGLRGQARVLGMVPRQGGKRLQLCSTEVTGGFSGGPLWDEQQGAVIGMVQSGTRADEQGRLPFTTFGVPAETLLQVCERLRLGPPVDRSSALVVHEPGDGYVTERLHVAESEVARRLLAGDFPQNVAARIRREPERWLAIGARAGILAAREAPFAAWALAEALCFREPGAPSTTRGDLWGALVAGRVVAVAMDLATVQAPHLEKLARLRRWLLYLMGGDDLPAGPRAEAGRVLARLGDPRPAVVNVDRMEFCLVPRGPFLMGSGEDDRLAYPEEMPRRRVEMEEDDWLARFPVTVAHFRAFVQDGGYANPAWWPEARAHERWESGEVVDWDGGRRAGPVPYGAPFDLDNHPVVGVTWYEAAAFARWLGARWGRTGRLPPGWRIRLPSEAEWEKGARGGTLVPRRPRVATPAALLLTHQAPLPQRPNPRPARRYPWGDEPFDGRQANGQASGIGATSAVGCFGAFSSPAGAEEMVGNVVEWTRNGWRSDGGGGLRPRHGADSMAARFSYFGSHPRWLRCASRAGLFPYGRDASTGFRVAIVRE